MAMVFLARASVLSLGGSLSQGYRKSAFVQRNKGIVSYSGKLGLVSFPVVHHRSLCARAADEVSASGSVDSTLIQNMEKKIKEQLDADFVAVKDTYGDGRHVRIDVISSSFEGQSNLNRQRMVYKVIWEELQNTVHAVDQMTTRTPLEVSEGSEL